MPIDRRKVPAVRNEVSAVNRTSARDTAPLLRNFLRAREAGNDSSRRTWRNVRHDIVLCTVVALVVGTGFSAYACLLYALKGPAPFERLGTTVGGTIGVYLIGSVLSGLLLGLLLPLGRSTAGAMVLGMVAVFPLYKGASFAMDGLDAMTWSDTLDALVLSVIAGSILGWWAHRQFN